MYKKPLIIVSFVFLASFFITIFWYNGFTGNYLVEISNISCEDQCDFVGQKSCSGNGYRLCGKYDNDECLDWGDSNSECFEGHVCVNNSCLNPRICTDSDNGGLNQIYVEGFVFKNNETLHDFCLDDKYIQEYSCVGSTTPAFTKTFCGYNYRCVNGSCVRK